MATKEQLREAGKKTRFNKDNQPNPASKGPKPSKVRALIEENDLGSKDIQAMSKWLLEKTLEEIKAIATDPKNPILITLYAKAVLDDVEKSGIYNAEQLLSRMIGKAKETVENTGTQTVIHIGKEFDKL